MAKIQIITTYEQGAYSACEALWLELAETALSAGHEVEVLLGGRAKSHQRTVALTTGGARLLFRRAVPKSRILVLFSRVWDRSLAAVLLARRIDPTPDVRILNVGTMSEIGLDPWASILENAKVPTAVIVHNNPEIRSYTPKMEQRLSRLLKNASRVYFVSDRLRNNAEEQLLMRIPNAVTVRNPVNLKSHEQEPWPCDDECLRFAVVGRLDAQIKGQIRLLHALSDDRWKDRAWSLTFFGDGPDKVKIKKAIAFYGLTDRVDFGGFVSDIRSEIWESHHVLVMPSLLEGMPLALVEAMLCGRPALCSDVGGASELVQDGHNGFIAGSPFSSQLVEALEQAWSARLKLHEMGDAAHVDAIAYVSKVPGEDLLDDLCAMIEGKY